MSNKVAIGGIYVLLIAVLTLLAIDLVESKSTCEETMLEWSQAQMLRADPDVIREKEKAAKKACKAMDVKAKVIGETFLGE